MGGLFGSTPDIPQMPAPQPIPPAPTIDDTVRAGEDADRRNKRRGRASTVLTSGDQKPAELASKALLGA